MTRWKAIACSLLLLAVSGVLAYPVFAHCGTCAADARKIAGQLDRNKTTLAKLVSAAEEHSKGRAISVISDLHDNDRVTVHVYCVVGDPPRIMKCYVDHMTGSVRGMKEVQEFPITAPAPHDPGNHDPGGPEAATTATLVVAQTLEVACGACVYKMPGVEGCPLAIMIDGKPYLVEGATWPNHDYCDRTCQAVVSGRLDGSPAKFIATSFEPKK